MTGLPALTLWQPWASLIALKVKTIETRSWPAPKSLIGQRIAIHAAKRYPALTDYEGHQVGEWHLTYDRTPAAGAMWRVRGNGTAGVRVPLGAIVATAVLTECVPMAHQITASSTLVLDQVDGRALLFHDWGHRMGRDETDQMPYGHFERGRWAWLLDEIAPTTERCPACWGSGESAGGRTWTDAGWEDWAEPCLTCPPDPEFAGTGVHVRGTGSCEPVPAKGRQGVWRWQP